jgi:hypothetical protein
VRYSKVGAVERARQLRSVLAGRNFPIWLPTFRPTATAEAMTASAPSQTDVFVLDTSTLLRLYLVDGRLPPSLEPAIQRGCIGDALLLVADL